MRGCVKGCRFCQAGYIYRPAARARPSAASSTTPKSACTRTGTTRSRCSSLSTGDYSCINPSDRTDEPRSPRNASPSRSRRRASTRSTPSTRRNQTRAQDRFHPRTRSRHAALRDVIQKEYREDELLEAAEQIFGLGWRSLKLYFMLGLPSETEEDLRRHRGSPDAFRPAATATPSPPACRPSCRSRTRRSNGPPR